MKRVKTKEEKDYGIVHTPRPSILYPRSSFKLFYEVRPRVGGAIVARLVAKLGVAPEPQPGNEACMSTCMHSKIS